MVWIGIFGGLLFLVLFTLVLKVKTAVELTLTAHLKKFSLTTKVGVVTLNTFFLAEGGRKEASITLALFGRRILIRYDIPSVKWSSRGLKPILKVFREVEAGFGTARPLKDRWERFSLGRLKELARQAIKAYSGLGPSFTYLISKTTLESIDIAIEEGTGSAPSTAIVSGALWGLIKSGTAFVSSRSLLRAYPRVRIIPNFNQRSISVDARAAASCYGYQLFRAIGMSLPVFISLLKTGEVEGNSKASPNTGTEIPLAT